MKMNAAVLNDLPSELYTIKANDKISDSFKYPLALIQAAQNLKQIKTWSLVSLLKLRIGAELIPTVNININNRLINDQIGNLLGMLYLLKVVFVKHM